MCFCLLIICDHNLNCIQNQISYFAHNMPTIKHDQPCFIHSPSVRILSPITWDSSTPDSAACIMMCLCPNFNCTTKTTSNLQPFFVDWKWWDNEIIICCISAMMVFWLLCIPFLAPLISCTLFPLLVLLDFWLLICSDTSKYMLACSVLMTWFWCLWAIWVWGFTFSCSYNWLFQDCHSHFFFWLMPHA